MAAEKEIKPFRFTSFGARVEITGNDQQMIDRGVAVAHVSLLEKIEKIRGRKVDVTLELNRTPGGRYVMIQNGERLTSTRNGRLFFKFFDSIVRAAVGEYSRDRVFIHAGVVGWRGKAIVLPADSFRGKSTLVTELVKCGAEYYSDDFAVLDADGLVHPFAKMIARRTEEYIPYQITPEEIGAVVGTGPIEVGTVLFTEYEQGVRWSPKHVSPGQGVLDLIPFTLSITKNAEFSFCVLKNVASRATILSSRRGEAEKFAKTLLNYVDKHLN